MNNKNIIIFSIHQWNLKYTSTIKFIAKELAENNYVIYINTPYTIKDVIAQFGSLMKNGTLNKILPFSNGVEQVKLPNGKTLILIYPPIVFSINFLPDGLIYRWFHFINHRIIAVRVNRFLRKMKIKEYIFINSFNFLYEGLDKFLKPELNIYHCVDELVKPVSLKHGLKQENEIISRADLVIVTSKGLEKKKSLINPMCFLVPNASDYAHFSKALQGNTKIHDCVAGLSKPIIGFVGVIERRFDYTLISYVAKRHPEWTFALIGPTQKEFIPVDFLNLENIYFQGSQPYEELPGILKGFDVAIIPYIHDKVSETIYPLKINEYLAAGKPIVSTKFNPQLIEEFSDVVYFADDEADFEKGIIQNLENMGDEIVNKRLKIASENSWSDRASQITDIMEDALKLK